MNENSLASLGVRNAVDTHVHPWRISDLPPVIQGAREVRPDLAQDYSPVKVIDTAAANGFTGVIFVQACDPHEGSLKEARFFIDAANQHPQVLGCVVGIDLLDPSGTEAFLDQIGDSKVVRACRMIAPENSGVGILADPRAKSTAKLLGERNLRLDLLIRSANPGQLSEGVELVQWLANNSSTTVIGDHLLKPTGVAEGTPSPDWISALRELARCNNFYIKVSGLPGEVPPGSNFEGFWAFYDAALEILGEQRLLFGSDYPVSYSHAASVKAVTDWIYARGLAGTHFGQQLFGDNARQAYGISW
jgi:L-fuconolactonase